MSGRNVTIHSCKCLDTRTICCPTISVVLLRKLPIVWERVVLIKSVVMAGTWTTYKVTAFFGGTFKNKCGSVLIASLIGQSDLHVSMYMENTDRKQNSYKDKFKFAKTLIRSWHSSCYNKISYHKIFNENFEHEYSVQARIYGMTKENNEFCRPYVSSIWCYMYSVPVLLSIKLICLSCWCYWYLQVAFVVCGFSSFLGHKLSKGYCVSDKRCHIIINFCYINLRMSIPVSVKLWRRKFQMSVGILLRAFSQFPWLLVILTFYIFLAKFWCTM